MVAHPCITGQSELTVMVDNKNYSQQVGNISLFFSFLAYFTPGLSFLFILNLTRVKKISDKLALPEKYLGVARL